MSDHHRGAYTPSHDAPLSFDARQSRGRRAFPTTLLISLLILIGLGVAIFMFYRSGVRGAGEAPTPVGTPVGEIKSPPPAQAQQAQDPGQGLSIYKAEGAAEAPASSAPPATFAAPPEQPLPRPVAPVAAQPIAPAKAAPAPASPPVQVAKTEPATAKAAPVAASPAAKPAPVPAKPAPKDAVGALLESKSPAPALAKIADAKKPAAAPAEAEASAANLAHGAAVVQFGAFSSAALATSEWGKLAKAYPAEMAGKGKLVESVQRNGKTLFRGAVSGFSTRADAVAFCAKLKADNKACIVR